MLDLLLLDVTVEVKGVIVFKSGLEFIHVGSYIMIAWFFSYVKAIQEERSIYALNQMEFPKLEITHQDYILDSALSQQWTTVLTQGCGAWTFPIILAIALQLCIIKI